MPTLNWTPPAPITYGTALGAAQLNATTAFPGTIVYSPAAGALLGAGVHTLSVTLTPDDAAHWAPRTVTTTLVVNKATPTVEISSAPLFYNAQPRQASVVVRGLGGAELNPFTVLYDGAAALPVNAGTYAVQVNYAGSANYASVTATGSLVINKHTPIMGPFGDITETYDGLPHGVNPAVTGYEGFLTPVVVTYNGSTTTPINAGVYAIEARYEGSANYNQVSHTATLTILKAVPYLQWQDPSGITYGMALGGDQLRATANVPGTFAYAPAAGAVLNAGSHTLSTTFTPVDPANYETRTITRPLSVSKANALVTWYAPPSIVYGTPLGALDLNATANTSGTFAYSPAVGTVLGAGTHIISVTVTPDDAANYNAATASVPVVVTKASPAITWANPADIVYGTALSGAQLNATANVAGTFVYSPAAGAVLSAGSQTLSVTFTPEDAANYNGATASVTVNVAKAASTIAWSNPASIVYGTALGGTQLNATASVAGTFVYSPASGTVLNAGPQQTLTVTFTPDDAANYSGATASVTLNVTTAAPTATWAAPAGIVYGTGLGGAQLNATASVDGTFTYSPSAGTVLNAGSHTLSVVFTPADTANYSPATASVTLNVAKASPQLVWPLPTAIPYGTPIGAQQLNAAAAVPGTFTYSPASGTVLNAGPRMLSVTLTPTDSANYTTAADSHVLNVTPAPLTIRANDMGKAFGAPLPPLGVTPTGFVNGESMASLSGSLVVTAAATAASPVGSYAITPSGVSSANYAIAFVTGTLTIVAAPTATTVVASPNPAGLNQPVTLTATVTPVSPGAGAPSGVVQFFDGGTLLGTVPVSGGTASLTTSGFAAGSHAILATYGGDASFVTSSGNGTLTVKTAAASSTTAVASSANPSVAGDLITLTATVTAPSGVSGSVAFYDGATLIGTATLSGTTARLFNVSLALGGHALTARYLGNATIPPSVSPALAQYVRASGASTRTSTVALTASPSPATLGSTVTLTATVTGSQNKAPTGVVLFMVNGFVLGQGTVSQTGSVTAAASLPAASLPHGTHRVEAVYLGDATFRASRVQISLVVN